LLIIAVYSAYLYLSGVEYSLDVIIDEIESLEEEYAEGNIDNTESIVTEDDDDTDEEVSCDFDGIIEEATNDIYNRVHFAYQSILEPNPRSPYAACKDILKSELIEAFDATDLFEYDEMEELNAMIEVERIEYLIDNNFVVYTAMRIWSVDIISGDIELLWEPSEPSMLGIKDLYVMTEDNTSRIYFLTTPSGLGGTEEDSEAINNAINDMCEAGDVGTFVYDESTGGIERLYTSEDCL
jgi:hypothetical protein